MSTPGSSSSHAMGVAASTGTQAAPSCPSSQDPNATTGDPTQPSDGTDDVLIDDSVTIGNKKNLNLLYGRSMEE